MPPLGMHMTLAHEIAGKVKYKALEADPGAYYLGATTPDIRVITRWDRARTHFFDLDRFEEQSSVASIFAAHPELAEASRLNESTAAFLSGYISHLEMDEAWIVEIYRPCFGQTSPLKGAVLANVLDRVLQYELDRRQREDPDAVQEIREHLLTTSCDITVGFIEQATLLRWREVSSDVLCQPPNWDRFSKVASRHLREYGVETEADLVHFLRNVPDLLDQSIREVTPERLGIFEERSRRRAREAIEEYLS